MTTKEFARQEGVTYEAVRQQIIRYSNYLTGHITKVGRTKQLDEYAIEFLRGKRKTNPVIIQQENKDAELQQLREENKALLIKVAALQEELLHDKDAIRQLQEDKIALLQAAAAPAAARQSFWSRIFGRK